MIQQSAAQFTRSAKKATEIVDDKLPDRQRGMWSFLTWSFFLAQAVATHEAFAKGHAMGDLDQDGGSDNGSGADSAAGKGLPPGMLTGISGFDIDPTAAAQFAAAIAAGAVTPQMLAAFQSDPALFQAFIDSLTGGHAGGDDGCNCDHSGNPATIDAALGGAISVVDDVVGGGQHGGIPFPSGPIGGINLPGLHLPVDIVIDLGLELGPDLGLGVSVDNGQIGLDLNAGSLLNLGLSLGGEGAPLSLGLLGLNIVGSNDSLISLSGDNGLLPLGPALAPVIHLTGLAHDLLDQPLQLASNVATPLVDQLTAPVTSLAGDALGIVGSTGLLASGGSIIQSATSLPLLNELFAHGQHTDYGVELSSSSSSDAGAAHASTGSSISTSVEALDVVAIAGHATDSIGELAGHVLPSVIEELNLRGFGDGFA